jgi:hypothetical protein
VPYKEPLATCHPVAHDEICNLDWWWGCYKRRVQELILAYDMGQHDIIAQKKGRLKELQQHMDTIVEKVDKEYNDTQ